MTTFQAIHTIATSKNCTAVIINESEDEMSPMEAIAYLSDSGANTNWSIEESLALGTLLIDAV